MESSRFEELPPSPTASTSSAGTYHDPDDDPLPASPVASPSRSPKADPVVDPEEDDDEATVWWTPSELRDILDRSTSLKVLGNTHFGQGRWESAMEAYKEGLVELPRRPVKGKGKEKAVEGTENPDEVETIAEGLEDSTLEDRSPQEQQETNAEQAEMKELTELRSILFANVAACCLKLERWKAAVEACDDALEDNPRYVKAVHRRAIGNEAIGSWSALSASLEDYKLLTTLPDVPATLRATARSATPRLEQRVKEAQKKEQDEVMGKLKDLGNTVLGKFGLSTNNFKFVEQPGGGYSMNFER